MSSEISLKAADNLAWDYDQYVGMRNWTGPSEVFRLLKPHVCSGMKLLDIGIGTGLSSMSFHKEGVNIYGLDGSPEMLKVCAKKKFTEELVLCDLTKDRLPFENLHFDLIISYGVFHIIGFIETIFKEVSMKLNENGLFLFSVVEMTNSLQEKFTSSSTIGIYENVNVFGITNYRHDDLYIRRLINSSNLKFLDKRTILAFKDLAENREFHFSIYVCKNNQSI